MLIRPISGNNYNTVCLPKFRSKPITPVTDTFNNSLKEYTFYTISDIKQYLQDNANNLLEGEIFNKPVTKDGNSLLMALAHIKPIPEDESDYIYILYKMSKLPKINYNQKDEMNISFVEWVLRAEKEELLDLIKDKKLPYDPILNETFYNIKNPDFKQKVIGANIIEGSFDLFERLNTSISKFLNLVNNDKPDETLIITATNEITEILKDINISSNSFIQRKGTFIQIFQPFMTKLIENEPSEGLDTIYQLMHNDKTLLKELLMSTKYESYGDFRYELTLKNIYYDTPNDFLDILISQGNKPSTFTFYSLDKTKVDKAKLIKAYEGYRKYPPLETSTNYFLSQNTLSMQKSREFNNCTKNVITYCIRNIRELENMRNFDIAMYLKYNS